jgi:hypothetical protein
MDCKANVWSGLGCWVLLLAIILDLFFGQESKGPIYLMYLIYAIQNSPCGTPQAHGSDFSSREDPP